MKLPVLWCRCESLVDIQNPVIGEFHDMPNGNPPIVPVRFGNGAQSDADSRLVRWKAPDTFNWNQWSIGFWLKSSYNITNGVISPADYRSFFGIGNGSSNYIEMITWGNTGISFRHTQGGGAATHMGPMTTGWTWNVNDILHIGVIFNQAGILGSSDRVRVYRNGVLKNSYTTAVNSIVPVGGLICCTSYSLGISGGDGIGACDNIKVYDYCLPNFNHYLNERGGLNDTIVVTPR